MCTSGFKNGYLFKNQDRTDDLNIRLAKREGFIGIVSGIGVHIGTNGKIGCAVNGVPTKRFGIKLAKINSEILRNCETIREAGEWIESKKEKIKPGSFILTDGNVCAYIEVHKNLMSVETELKEAFATNHFISLNILNPPYHSSQMRLNFIKNVSRRAGVEELKTALRNHNEYEKNASVCRHGYSKTISSAIIDFKRKKFLTIMDKPCRGWYKEYSF